MMRHCRWLIVICFIWFSACTTFYGVTPLYPEVGHPNFAAVVDTLQPTLRWKPSAESDATSYDLIIYECVKITASWQTPERRILGKEVYYREGLNQIEHKIEEPLKPDTEYFWSVRIRQGSKVSAWSKYNHEFFLGVGYARWTNLYFLFKTPSVKIRNGKEESPLQ